MEENTKPTYREWSILELMGHRKLAGMVTDEEHFGISLIRIDVPKTDSGTFATQFYHPKAMYGLTPTTEEIARRFAQNAQPAPVTRWELPALPAQGEIVDAGDRDLDDFDHDYADDER